MKSAWSKEVSIIIIFLQILFVTCFRFKGCSRSPLHLPRCRHGCYAFNPNVMQKNDLPRALVDRLVQYFQHRESDIIVNSTSSTFSFNLTSEIIQHNQKILEIVEGKSAKPEKSANSLVTMFKPSGWYRDNSTDEVKAMLREEFPVFQHPLSYPILSSYGFADITPILLDSGGPFEVGKKIGLRWEVPTNLLNPRALFEEKDAIRKAAGSKQKLLALGGALEEQLAAAESLRLEEIKERLNAKMQQQQISNSNKGRSSMNNIRNSANNEPDYSQMVKTIPAVIKSKSIEKKPEIAIAFIDPQQRRLELQQRRYNSVYLTSPFERVHFASLLLTTAMSWGRSSQEMHALFLHESVGDITWTAIRITSLSLLLVSIITASMSFQEAKMHMVNPYVWLCRSFMGGLPSLNIIRNMSPVMSQTSDKE